MGWADFFDQPSGANSDLGSFNYQTEADKIKRKRELASALLQRGGQGQQGQFIKNGDFIGYAGGNTLMSAALQGLQAYMGMKGMEGADRDQGDLDKRSLEALDFNLNNKPWEKATASAAAPAEPSGAPQGAWQDNPETQSFPVPDREPPVVRSLVDKPAAQRIGAILSSATPTTGGPLTYAGPGEFKPLATPPSSISADQVKAASAKLGKPLSADDITLASSLLGGAKAPAPQATPVASPAVLPQPTSAPVPQAAPQALMPPPAAAMPQPQAQASVQPAAAPQGPSMAEQMAYLQRISNSGPAGQQLAQQMMAKPQLQHVTVKNDDGSESVVAFDPSGRTKPQVVYAPPQGNGPSPAQLKRDEFAGKAYEQYSKAQEELNSAQQQYTKIQNARDLMTRYAPAGGVFSSLYGSVAKALGNDQANALDMALKDLAFSDLRATFGGNPTEGERKAQMDVKASIERGLAPSLSALDTLAAGVERRMRLGAQQSEQWRSMYDQYRTQQPARASGSGLVDSLFPVRR